MISFPVSTNQLDYDIEKKQFSAEMSTLDMGGTTPVWCQAYNDACDEGIKVVSAHTGKSVMYVVEKVDYIGEGSDREIAGWHLIPTAESIRQVPMCKGSTLFIIND